MIYAIQVLRGIAALLVMLYHYSDYLKPVIPGANIGSLLFAGGYAGVDIFYILSGFIIVHSTDRVGHSNPVDFAIRRFFRVVPLAQLATVVYALILPIQPESRLLWQSLLFAPRVDADPPKFGFPVVHQEWTLTYELIFYAIFASVLVFTHKRRVVASALVILACVVGFQWILGGPISPYPNGVFLPANSHGILSPEILGELGNPIMLEFVFGMALAVAYSRAEGWLTTRCNPFAGRLVGLALAGLFLASYFSRNDPGNGLLNKGFGAACLVIGALFLEGSFRRLSAGKVGGMLLSCFLWLGAVSYPLYLVHLGISERLLRFLARHLLELRVDGLWGFLALIATSLALASTVHILVERRLIHAGKLLTGYRVRLLGRPETPKSAPLLP